MFWHLSAMHFNIYKDQFLLINSTKVLFTVTNDDFFSFTSNSSHAPSSN